MKAGMMIALLALGTAGCSEPAAEKVGEAEAASAEIDTAGYDIAVRCQASFDAVARLYKILSEQATGAEREEMAATATQRSAAAEAYRGIARSVGTKMGRSGADVDAAIKAAAGTVDAEFEKRPFEDFASWVAQEADRCPPPST
ncbi:hypothetical protein EAO27_02715 [Sphingopyxis sp. YF1]|uniref:hypothetical protein n=1 Tax=Sphingopyxis sp. YF1 TaxID=2482763 RepID=UPI001F605EB9|nr:hypothetical protein [Sphingopyxis sp. YF1]UNU41745.1 hypothetical protein EAO27_02715 [Sphingopyxis sp. YF1]